jgi:hypothetical protein
MAIFHVAKFSSQRGDITPISQLVSDLVCDRIKRLKKVNLNFEFSWFNYADRGPGQFKSAPELMGLHHPSW